MYISPQHQELTAEPSRLSRYVIFLFFSFFDETLRVYCLKFMLSRLQYLPQAVRLSRCSYLQLARQDNQDEALKLNDYFVFTIGELLGRYLLSV